jgi:CRISPR-associated endonuclease/helicase Cas3
MFGVPGYPTAFARRWLRFFRIPEADFDNFLHNLWLAAAFHDLGKANDGFQRAVRANSSQTIRHEHLSALLLWQEPLQNWLQRFRGEGVDPEIIVSAVVSHHLKVSDKEFAQRLVDSKRPVVEVYASAPEVAAVLAKAGRLLQAQAPDIDSLAGPWDFAERIDPSRSLFERDMYKFKRSLTGDETRRRLLLAVKAGVIAVDTAGSGLPRTGENIEEWLSDAFVEGPLRAEDVERAVVEPRVAQLGALGKWHGFHDFQIAAANLGPRALLLSGCGTGKTLAAWKWIEAQVARSPASRVIFLYPTRATATEGFRDYVSWAGPEESALVSGTSRFDLEGMFANPSDPRHGGDYAVPERLFAVGYWKKRAFSATVDSFLALMSNRYAALCLAPVLADSVIVADEVHSFDRSMFTALERFLTFFDVPVLCMTASLPERRREILRETCGLEEFPRDPSEFSDLIRQAELPRYRVRWIEPRDVLEHARRAVLEGKKVLWVHNTVARCQKAAQLLEAGLAGKGVVLCYHSRFRLLDRRQRHEDAISLYRNEQRGSALVTTQVCEMSLDLDADVLISEAAPVPALIQRMGRCCREPIPRAGRIGEVFIYKPEHHLPYERDEVEQGESFARYLEGHEPAGHADLSGYLDELKTEDPEAVGGWTGFLDSGWYAMARDDSFRDDNDVTVDCVLDSDRVDYLRERAAGMAGAAGYVLPVPRRFASIDATLPRYMRIAPATHYDPRYGFLEKQVAVDG